MSVSKVRKAFVGAVKDQVALLDPVLPVAWPNVKFNPPSNSPWLAFHWVPADSGAATMGDGGEDELVGFVQVDVNVPQDSGEAATETVLTALENHFIAGREVINDSQVATVVSSSRSSGRAVDPYWRTSLTINFYARITRPTITA